MDACKRELGTGRYTNGGRRFFSPSEANGALVLVRKIVDDILSDYSRLVDLQETLQIAQQSGRYDQAEQVGRQITEVVRRVQDFAKELDHVGVSLTDWMLGMVDFPCAAAGREVVLCWRVGEPEVAYWHESDAECSTRKPLESLPLHRAEPAWTI